MSTTVGKQLSDILGDMLSPVSMGMMCREILRKWICVVREGGRDDKTSLKIWTSCMHTSDKRGNKRNLRSIQYINLLNDHLSLSYYNTKKAKVQSQTGKKIQALGYGDMT